MSEAYIAPDVTELNAEFGHPGQVQFVTGSGGQTRVDLRCAGERASLYLQGAHITSYLAGGEEVLWNSHSAQYQPGKAIRGGIPLCWPWFGAHPVDASLPQHGFARNSDFAVVAVVVGSEEISMQLRLVSTLQYDRWCDGQGGQVEFLVDVRLSNKLYLQVTTINHTDQQVVVGGALHTYYRVADVARVSVPALTGLTYKDKLGDYAQLHQTQPFNVLSAQQTSIAKEGVQHEIEPGIDRVYLSPPASMVVQDPVQKRTITLRAWGNADMVVWNPGPRGAAAMSDFDDLGYLNMLCIEPALALDNTVSIVPGGSHQLGQEISTINGAF
jgi:D-hexose-6-phosphate mutarotase